MANLLPTNENMVERVLRVTAGVALVVLAATSKIGVWGYLGLIPLVTGIIGSCPLYTLFGFSTCPLSKRQ